MKLKIELTREEIDTMPIGSVYEAPNGAVLMTVGEGKAVRFSRDSGEIDITLIEHPSKPRKVLGKLTGIII